MFSLSRLYYSLFLIFIHNQTGQLAYASNLLTSYLPASMQALAYYIDLLQYEPLSSTTIEPPFEPNDSDNNEEPTTPKSTTTTQHTPSGSTSNWWQPPQWWSGQQAPTATERPTAAPTPSHKPGLYAPPRSLRSRIFVREREGQDLFEEILDKTNEFISLPLHLIRDIQTESEHDEFTNDVESLDNFLRLYDDNYGRANFDLDSSLDRWSTTSIAGKKRIPPTKPYVDFLLAYDLLKRDAKAENLSKYEGYSDEILNDLHKLSYVSAERQLYSLFKRMLERQDIQRSDVVSRIKGIMKDLSNPDSVTVKSLRYIPALVFLP